MKLYVNVSTHLSFDARQLPGGVAKQLIEALRVPNEAKVAAMRRKQKGWQGMPDYFELFEMDGNTLHIPRGFAMSLKRGCAANGLSIEWIDNMVAVPVDTSDACAIELRRHQVPAVEKILGATQGVYWAPTGSGKTVTALEAWRRSGQRGVILVEKAHLADQWRKEAIQHLKIHPGIIGAGHFDQSQPLTIAMLQTLHSRRDELRQAGFFREFGFLCVDECHHTPAGTYADVVQSFPARIRVGVSASPETGDMEFRVVKIVLGDVFYRTTDRELEEAGVIVKPTIEVVRTEFTGDASYEKLMGKLELNVPRNRLIASKIVSEPGRHHIVLSRRLKHLDRLREETIRAGFPADRCFMLTGKETREERSRLKKLVPQLDQSVTFSTIGYEALDIPRLDTLHMAWPTRRRHIIQQSIGRVTRTCDGKKDAKAYDYFDVKLRVGAKQFHERRKYYEERDFVVVGVLSSLSRRRPLGLAGQ